MHNLEHGSVWITYRDADDVALADKLGQLTRLNAKVVVSPRLANDSAIAAASWGRLLTLDAYDQPALEQFVQQHTNQAPEPSASCGA